jgi:predicted Zn-dependent peptidase
MKEKAEFDIFELSNGLKVVHKKVDRPVAHCGLFINAGTRDELEGESGLAHFIEHAIFKGTTNRRAYHILNRLDSVGGELDAYTTKEMTCLHASFLTEYYGRALELLSDIILHSTFPEMELEKEKEVVLDEILLYQDSPADQIYDDFEAQVFQGHALGNPILGSKKSVRNLSREKILNYMTRLYKAENIVISSVGNISKKRLKRKLEKYFATVPKKQEKFPRLPFSQNDAVKNYVDQKTVQSHCIMGRATYGGQDPQRLGLSLLNNMLGGPAMNSILNLKVREKYGFTYNVESNYAMYSDSGIFSIYVACDPKYLERCQQAIFKELKQLRQKPLSSNKLHLAKQQLKGQMAIARESNANLMISYGKSLLYRGKIKPIEEIHSSIDKISASDLQEIAQSEFQADAFDILVFEGKGS